MRDRHEHGKGRPPKECVVCHFKISYLKLHVLDVEVFPSFEHHGKGDLADRGSCYVGDYSMERSLARP
jgi:hypothetical protein